MQNQQRVSSCVFLLSCLLLSQPLLAARQSNHDGQMMVDGQMGGSMMNETAVDAVEGEMCNPFSSQSLKRYFFDIVFEDDGENVQSKMAIELLRDPVHPHLKVYSNKSWEVGLSSCDAPKLEYSTEGPVDAEVDIDILNDVSYVKLSYDDHENAILEIEHTGGKLSFAGGIYYAPEIMLPQLKAQICHLKNTAKSAADLRDADLSDLMGKPLPSYVKADFKDGVPVAAIAEAAGKRSKIFAWSSIAVSVGLLATGPAMLAVAMGVGLSLPFVYVGGMLGWGQYDKNKFSKLAGYAASKKIFDKLKCHPKMSECKGGLWPVLVPEGKTCPQ